MTIKVNGEPQKVASDPLTVAKLLEISRVESPEMVSIQVNGEFVERGSYPTTVLKEQDEVDFLYFMGGGTR